MGPSTLLYVELIGFCVALFCAGLFAFLETAFTALRLFRVKELKVRVARYRSLFASWEKNPQRILITILIANNLAHVISSVLITEIMQRLIGDTAGLTVGITLATLLILFFGEIIPKSYAKTHYDTLFTSTLGLINILYKVLYPLVSVLLAVAQFFYTHTDGTSSRSHDEISEKEIEFLIDYSDEQGLMEAEKTEMLQNVFGLGNTLACDIIVPKSDMVIIDVATKLEDALKIFTKYRYSRLPVYEGKKDNIIGLFYQKDIFALLSKGKQKSLRELLRPVLFVPETKKINQLLREFLEKKMHMAIVIDEYGEISGLVTLEDVIEEIVGDIHDEDEKETSEVVTLAQGRWLVDARISLDRLEEVLGIEFEAEESVTLGGFLAEHLQHVPRKGERLSYKDHTFQVQQANRKRVFQVIVIRDYNGDEEHS